MTTNKQTAILGIDIGGSGIKGALVDVNKGELIGKRHRIPTPKPSTPSNVAKVIAKIVKHFDYSGPIGSTFPAIVKNGVTLSAANVDDSWIGADADAIFEKTTGQPVHMLNDADAAGIAEMAFGAGKDQSGVVFMLTLGTGIGSGVFVNGVLMPNTELGHLELNGKEVEHVMSDKARSENDLSWKKWAKLLQSYFDHLEFIFSPDLFIIGGGVSKKSHKFLPLIETKAKIVPAKLLNEAGIIGAAYAVKERQLLPE